MDSSTVDIAMPTYESGDIVESTLRAVEESFSNSAFEINRLIVVDNCSEDGTADKISDICDEFDWERKIICERTSLAEARQILIEEVRTEWFLFLDDDAIVSPEYISKLTDSVAPLTGAVQGRKSANSRSNADWTHRRSIRGGTHATLIRHAAVAGIEFPPDLNVLEDEYLRRYVENERSYLWIFNHQAIFDHRNQGRHPVGWTEGYLAGKYGLIPAYRILVDLPASIKARNNPLSQLKRMSGYASGKVVSIVS
jgi:glycosyltransferase involved in cell wall biosynthesis